jgi:hypothetical protein
MSHRFHALLVAGITTVALACGDVGTITATGSALYLTNGSDSASQPRRDSSGSRSSSPRAVAGTALGMGPAGDTASYSKVAGVAVTIRLPDSRDDSASHTRGQQVAAATSDANGRYSLGGIKPGAYILEAVPPSTSPYKTTTWGFLITDYMPNRIELGVVLYRR